MRAAVALLALLAAPAPGLAPALALAQEGGAADEPVLDEPLFDEAVRPILDRRPEDLPRAEPGRWAGAFEPETTRAVLGSIAPERLAAYGQAEAAYVAGDFPRALERLYAVLDGEPDAPPALLLLGTTYFRLRRYGDTIVALERFVEVAPSQVWRTQALGHAYYSLGRYAEARDHYERLLGALAGDSVEALRGLGLAHMRLGDEERALEVLGRVVELRPHHADALGWIAQIRYDRGELEEALAAIERSREHDPYTPRVWFLTFRILFELGRDEEARAAQERWREVDRLVQDIRNVEGRLLFEPRDFGLALQLVELYRELGDRDGVREALERTLFARPPEVEEVEARIHVLDVLVGTGDLDGARAAARALELACPHEARTWDRLREFYARIGDRDAEIRAGERYLRYAGQDEGEGEGDDGR